VRSWRAALADTGDLHARFAKFGLAHRISNTFTTEAGIRAQAAELGRVAIGGRPD